LPFELGFGPILQTATTILSKQPAKFHLQGPIRSAKVTFWPSYKNSEPDVTITFPEHLIMVEAKYHHGKSGDFNETDIPSQRMRDQLAREFLDLQSIQGKMQRSLVYITKHSSPPIDDLKRSQKALEQHSSALASTFQQNVYWTSWMRLRQSLEEIHANRTLQEHQMLILGDLLALLERKGFRAFRGYSSITTHISPSPAFFSQTGQQYFQTTLAPVEARVPPLFDLSKP
jgi:hypothetical protein